MKSYIIKIELQDTNPLVWRRVIMPAGATFNRLHDVIQNVTNFQGGYPSLAYHLFEFDLTKENMIPKYLPRWLVSEGIILEQEVKE